MCDICETQCFAFLEGRQSFCVGTLNGTVAMCSFVQCIVDEERICACGCELFMFRVFSLAGDAGEVFCVVLEGAQNLA